MDDGVRRQHPVARRFEPATSLVIASALVFGACEPSAVSAQGHVGRMQLALTEPDFIARDAVEQVLASDEDVRGDLDGRFTAHFDALALELPMRDGEDQRVFSLPLSGVVLTGTLELDGIRDLVLAGVIRRAVFESEFVLPLITPLDPSSAFPGGGLEGLFDVVTDPETATCDGLSVGLSATATALPAHQF